MDRNAPCPCGSKKKYKKCCLLADQKSVEKRETERHFIIPVIPELDEECGYASDRIEAGDLEGAKKIVKRLSRLYPGTHQIYFLQGVCFIQESAFAHAIACFEEAVQINPFFSEAYYNLASSYKKNFEVSKSVACLRRVMEIEGKQSELGQAACRDLQELETIIRKASGLSLDEYLKQQELYDNAFGFLKAGDYEKAIGLFRQVVAMTPDHVQSYGNLGLAYAGLGNKDMALECIEKAISLDPTYEPALFNRKVIQKLAEGKMLNSKSIEIDYYRECLEHNKRVVHKEV